MKDERVWTGLSGSGQGQVVSSCEQSNEPLVSLKGGILLDYLSDS
jgi:hypothetical protein